MKITSAQFMISAHKETDFPQDGCPEIAFLGRSNVGKSRAINCLLKRSSLARISSSPGRTRGIHFYLINEAFYFVDLPGYGYAKVPENVRLSWKTLVDAYLTDRSQIALGLLIIDSRHDPRPLDEQMQSWLVHSHVPYLIILTKADKLSRHRVNQSVRIVSERFPRAEVIPFSAVTRLGVQDVWRAIRARL